MLHRPRDPVRHLGELVLAPERFAERGLCERVPRVGGNGPSEGGDGAVHVVQAAIETLQVAPTLDERLVRAGDARPAGRERTLLVRLQFEREQAGERAHDLVLHSRLLPAGEVEGPRGQLHLLGRVDQVEGQPDGLCRPLYRAGDRERGAERLQPSRRWRPPW